MMMRTLRCLAVLLAGAAVLLTSEGVRAETCTVSAGGVAFGVYDPLGVAPLDSTSTIQVTFNSETPPQVTYEIQ